MKNYWIKTFRRLAAATVVAVSSMFYSAMCYANALDVATNPPYADGWQAGDNGGTGFGAWSFNGTDATPPGTYQGITSSSPIGTSWTLFTNANNTGLANAGRAVTGGLLPGQTFETVVQNPTAYHFFRGFDILFTNGPDNNVGGNNAAALRISVFDYFNAGSQNWGLNDAGGGTDTGLSSLITGAAGVKIDLKLTSPTGYSLTMTPLNGGAAYTHSGTLAGPIGWVDYRLYDGASAGPNDTANNFAISRMSVVPEPATFSLLVLGGTGLAVVGARRKR
jgi:hypothetical protein